MNLELMKDEEGEPLVHCVMGGKVWVTVQVNRHKWMDVLCAFRAAGQDKDWKLDWMPIGHVTSLEVSGGLSASRFAVARHDVGWWQEYFHNLPQPVFDPPRL